MGTATVAGGDVAVDGVVMTSGTTLPNCGVVRAFPVVVVETAGDGTRPEDGETDMSVAE